MRIYVDMASPAKKLEFAGYLHEFRQLAHHDRWGNHILSDSPEQADCILFIDAHVSASNPFYHIVDDHPYTHKYPEKVMVYDESDRPPSFGRGIYVSLPKRLFNPNRHSVVCYWLNVFDKWELHQFDRARSEYCFFAGQVSQIPVRARIVKHLTDSVVRIKDTSAVSPWKTGSNAPTHSELQQSRRDYTELMMKHQYCLSPRGNGTSSIRLFEAFLYGAVPIVMADEYVPPHILNWNDCVVNINQRRPREIILRQHQLQNEFNVRQQLVNRIQCDYFALDSRWNFFGNEIERVMNSGSIWRTRSHIDAAKTKLYWLEHRIIKRIEGRFV